jgi:hypothetical protein
MRSFHPDSVLTAIHPPTDLYPVAATFSMGLMPDEHIPFLAKRLREMANNMVERASRITHMACLARLAFTGPEAWFTIRNGRFARNRLPAGARKWRMGTTGNRTVAAG